MKPLYLLHVIKTGGTTILCKLWEADPDLIKWGHDLLCKDADPLMWNTFTVIRDPADWLVSIYHQAKRREGFDAGFEVFYEWHRNNKVNPERGRYNRLCNYAKRFWACRPEEVSKKLDALWGVTVTDRLDEDLPLLFSHYGLSPGYKNQRVTGEYDEIDKAMTPKVYSLTEEMRERIYKENPLDVELYQRAMELRELWTQRLR